MRVPVYSEDLLPQSGFKRIAKRVQKLWPGPDPINLSRARELLSKWLGYNDYHDVVQGTKSSPTNSLSHFESEVRRAIALDVQKSLNASHELPIAAERLQVFVDALPLHALVSFKHLQSQLLSNAPMNESPSVIDAEKAQLRKVAAEDPLLKSGIKKPLGINLSGRIITPQQIEAIRTQVQSSGNLRDQCLFALMETGHRSHTFLSVKATLITSDDWLASFLIDNQGHPILLQDVDTVKNYIRCNKLDTDDYLFPSMNDPKQPMTAREFSKIFKTWKSYAVSDDLKATQHDFRAAIIKRLYTTDIHGQIANQLGHSQLAQTLYYTQPFDTTQSNAPAPAAELGKAD